MDLGSGTATLSGDSGITTENTAEMYVGRFNNTLASLTLLDTSDVTCAQ